MKNLDKLYVYDNGNLSVLIINKYKNNPFIVYEKHIEKFRISDLKQNTFLDKVKNKIIEIENQIEGHFQIQEENVKLLYNGDEFYLKEVKYEKSFDQKTTFNAEDINRIINQNLAEEKIDNSLTIEKCHPKCYIIDGHVYDSFENKSGINLSIILEILVVDKKVKNELDSLFSLLRINVYENHIIDYYVLKNLKSEKSCLVDLNYEHNKVFLRDNKIYQLEYLNTGIGTILDKVYEVFLSKYPQPKAEELTRIVKKYWLLKKFAYQYDIIEEVNISIVIDVLEHVLYQYFSLLFSKLPKEKEFEKVYINSSEIPQEELVDFLGEKFDYDFEMLVNNNRLISSILDKKVTSCIRKIYKEK